jgi:hypothetical protein
MELPGNARIAEGRMDLAISKAKFVKSRIHLVLSVSSVERKRSIGCPLSFARRPKQ